MTWENYDPDGWHCDHVRPLKTFDPGSKEQVLVAFNWRNYMPLWGRGDEGNLSKGAKFTATGQSEWVERMRDKGFDGDLFLLDLTD